VEPRGKGETKVVLETAGGEPWTMRHQRQATLGKRSKSWSRTEGDDGQFSWTYAPQGVKGNKHKHLVTPFCGV